MQQGDWTKPINWTNHLPKKDQTMTHKPKYNKTFKITEDWTGKTFAQGPIITAKDEAMTHKPKQAETAPTPGPWRIAYQDEPAMIYGFNDIFITKVQGDAHTFSQANAAHIVKCVNAHNALVEALRRIERSEPRPNKRGFIEYHDFRNLQIIARAALRLA